MVLGSKGNKTEEVGGRTNEDKETIGPIVGQEREHDEASGFCF